MLTNIFSTPQVRLRSSTNPQRQPRPGCIRQTDRGSQYAAERYLQRLPPYEIVPRMSRTGHCWDNAVAESFFHTLQPACVDLETCATRKPAPEALFEYIEVFYNRQRRHSANGPLAPVLYEQSQKAA
jgi:putative transposase